MCKELSVGEQSKKNGAAHWNMPVPFSCPLNHLSGNRRIHRGHTGNGKMLCWEGRTKIHGPRKRGKLFGAAGLAC